MLPFRVMQLLSSFEMGGAEMVALNLSRHLNEELFDTSVCSLSEHGPMTNLFRSEGIDTFSVQPPRRAFFSTGRFVKRLAGLIHENRIHILHCHNAFALTYGTLAGRLAGTPVIVSTRHAISLKRKVGQPWGLERALTPLVSHYIGVSQEVLRRGIRTKRMHRDRASVIPNGVDTESFGRDNLASRKKGPLILGCVARLSEEKRHKDLLRAFGQLWTKGRDVRLYLVGDGPLRENLQGLARELGIQQGVEFMGMRNDIPNLLSRFDIFSLSSSFEGLPLTIIEAMAGHLPVIATRVGSIHELVEDGVNGFLVPPGDPGELASAIEKLVCDAELRQRMGAAGRRKAVRQFSIQTAARKHEELYRALLDNHGFGR